MLTRNLLLLFSLVLLLVEADLNSNDKESTSDEAPTESMNAISPHHPDTSSSSSETADAPAANQLTAPEPAAVSVEEEEDNEHSKSKEGGNKKFRPRSAKPARPAHPPQRPALMITNQSPTLPSQPIIPQLKALVRNQKPKRRSRINRL
ncbi:uncharacterized protein si:ch211-133n4.6 isoform X2 [Pungitius pungitius]|uniref:uncharacterized protein si:ch211-133n4.6 isoform X2 n=1 Tax=Pungitius pungitius TaxID=134920 RepID=UPI001887314A|nr:uncharacterized protein si:ch211-133n4.6 isoform X2 [Pungitius pungitius]